MALVAPDGALPGPPWAVPFTHCRATTRAHRHHGGAPAVQDGRRQHGQLHRRAIHTFERRPAKSVLHKTPFSQDVFVSMEHEASHHTIWNRAHEASWLSHTASDEREGSNVA